MPTVVILFSVIFGQTVPITVHKNMALCQANKVIFMDISHNQDMYCKSYNQASKERK